MTKVVASDVGWKALNKAFQVHGGTAYMDDHPLSKALRDFRIFPIFEGANDVMRAYVALNGIKALSEALPDVRSLTISDPAKAIGVLAPYVAGRVNRALRPEKLAGAHASVGKQVSAVSEQVARLRDRAEAALRKHGKKVQEKQLIQKRLSDAASGIYAQVAVISRITAVTERDGVSATAAERALAVNFCESTARQVGRDLRSLEINSDGATKQLGKAVRESNGYAFDL